MPELKHERDREWWIHEDSLINRRINWLLLGQTLLFNAYAVAVGTEPSTQALALAAKMPYMGIAVSLLIGAAIFQGLLAQEKLKAETADAGFHSYIDRIVGWLAPIGIPVVFASVWISLIEA